MRAPEPVRAAGPRALSFQAVIAAPRAHVWRTMLDEAGYRHWTRVFCEGSRYVGRWDVGAEIDFVAADGCGLRARVVAHWPREVVVLHHVAALRDGRPSSAAPGAAWRGCREEYLFGDAPGGTLLRVELTVPDEWAASMARLWPAALAELKSLCESTAGAAPAAAGARP